MSAPRSTATIQTDLVARIAEKRQSAFAILKQLCERIDSVQAANIASEADLFTPGSASQLALAAISQRVASDESLAHPWAMITNQKKLMTALRNLETQARALSGTILARTDQQTLTQAGEPIFTRVKDPEDLVGHYGLLHGNVNPYENLGDLVTKQTAQRPSAVEDLESDYSEWATTVTNGVNEYVRRLSATSTGDLANQITALETEFQTREELERDGEVIDPSSYQETFMDRYVRDLKGEVDNLKSDITKYNTDVQKQTHNYTDLKSTYDTLVNSNPTTEGGIAAEIARCEELEKSIQEHDDAIRDLDTRRTQLRATNSGVTERLKTFTGHTPSEHQVLPPPVQFITRLEQVLAGLANPNPYQAPAEPNSDNHNYVAQVNGLVTELDGQQKALRTLRKEDLGAAAERLFLPVARQQTMQRKQDLLSLVTTIKDEYGFDLTALVTEFTNSVTFSDQAEAQAQAITTLFQSNAETAIQRRDEDFTRRIALLNGEAATLAQTVSRSDTVRQYKQTVVAAKQRATQARDQLVEAVTALTARVRSLRTRVDRLIEIPAISDTQVATFTNDERTALAAHKRKLQTELQKLITAREEKARQDELSAARAREERAHQDDLSAALAKIEQDKRAREQAQEQERIAATRKAAAGKGTRWGFAAGIASGLSVVVGYFYGVYRAGSWGYKKGGGAGAFFAGLGALIAFPLTLFAGSYLAGRRVANGDPDAQEALEGLRRPLINGAERSDRPEPYIASPTVTASPSHASSASSSPDSLLSRASSSSPRPILRQEQESASPSLSPSSEADSATSRRVSRSAPSGFMSSHEHTLQHNRPLSGDQSRASTPQQPRTPQRSHPHRGGHDEE